jgi:multisubunit Na+/H+ antiporter MnhB subunit
MNTVRYYLPGIILIMIAIIIVALPEVIVAFVASIIIIAGIVALYIGHKIRKSEIECRRTDAWSSNEDLFGRRVVKRPLFRRWSRWF